MNETMIRRAFAQKQDEVRKDTENIYAEIAEIVKRKPVEYVTKEIPMAEASRLNAYSQKLEQSLRSMACETMTGADVPANTVNIIWARAKRKAGVAQIALCKEERERRPEQISKTPEAERQTGNRETSKGAGSALIVSGAAAEIVGWVFIPGMGKFAAAVKGIGLVMIAAGAFMVGAENKEEPRIQVSEEIKRQESGKIIDGICEKQCRLNTEIFCKWLDKVCEAVLQECRNECGR